MKRLFLICVIFSLVLAACGEEPNTEATVMAAIAATQTAAPTSTATPVPTDTATPIPTDTPTPVPTDTPTATPTAVPTDTPTPAPTDTPTPASSFETATLDNGWVRYESSENNFAVALPPEWIYLDLTSEDTAALLATAAEANPEFADVVSSQNFSNLAAMGIKFYAIDFSADSASAGFPTNMNILIQELPIALPLEEFVNVSAAQVTAIFNADEPAVAEVVTIGEREMGKITYQLLLNTTGVEQNVGFTQYVILEGELAYIITFTSLVDLQETSQAVFEEIMASVEIGE